jgi:hypothetical protein
VFGLDLVLLHAPSVWDFREEVILQGPLADVIPSTTQFEMYPIGMTSIAAYLEANNYNVRMVNLAYRMLRKPGYDVPARIASLDAAVFGIDLHWLPHANGALGVAELAATRRHGRRQPADVRPRGPGLDRRARVRLHAARGVQVRQPRRLPAYLEWLRYPSTMLLNSRGCELDCAICGGSSSAYSRVVGRSAPAACVPQGTAHNGGCTQT